MEFIVLSPCYETIRYGQDFIKKRTIDAHAVGKFTKFIYGPSDLKDPTKPPTLDNLKFESRQALDADVTIFSDKIKDDPPTDPASWGRKKKRVAGSRINKYSE